MLLQRLTMHVLIIARFVERSCDALGFRPEKENIFWQTKNTVEAIADWRPSTIDFFLGAIAYIVTSGGLRIL